MSVSRLSALGSSLRTLVVASLLVPAAACLHDVVDDPGPSTSASAGDAALIHGRVDWKPIASLPDGSAIQERARAVGLLLLPAQHARCTAFLVAPNVVVTNAHCAPDARHARGATLDLLDGEGPWLCDRFRGADADLDVAVLGCLDAPGDDAGVLPLDGAGIRVGRRVAVVHVNCDTQRDPQCMPAKLVSPGSVFQRDDDTGDVMHDADTLPGSSGSPVLNARGTAVIALHHVGAPDGNRAVPMSAVLPWLRDVVPELRADGGDVDDHEPDDLPAEAAEVALPFDGALVLSEDDVDHFTFTHPGGRLRVRLDVAGDDDVDLQLLDEEGHLVVASEEPGADAIDDAFTAGAATIRVIGVHGSSAAYRLRIDAPRPRS